MLLGEENKNNMINETGQFITELIHEAVGGFLIKYENLNRCTFVHYA